MAKTDKVNLRKVLNKILTEGGISFSLTAEQSDPKTGYMVSLLGFEKRFNINEVADADVKNYVYNNINELWGSNRFLGGFKDNDEVVLDVSINIENATQACYTGIINNQKYIYDCVNKRSILLPTPQTSGTSSQQKAYAKMKAAQFAYLLETTGVE